MFTVVVVLFVSVLFEVVSVLPLEDVTGLFLEEVLCVDRFWLLVFVLLDLAEVDELFSVTLSDSFSCETTLFVFVACDMSLVFESVFFVPILHAVSEKTNARLKTTTNNFFIQSPLICIIA